jgi:hypothetical protein
MDNSLLRYTCDDGSKTLIRYVDALCATIVNDFGPTLCDQLRTTGLEHETVNRGTAFTKTKYAIGLDSNI